MNTQMKIGLLLMCSTIVSLTAAARRTDKKRRRDGSESPVAVANVALTKPTAAARVEATAFKRQIVTAPTHADLLAASLVPIAPTADAEMDALADQLFTTLTTASEQDKVNGCTVQ